LENYPLTPDEAFMASQFDSFITADLVMQARKEEVALRTTLDWRRSRRHG
jgi:hypothetical protein